MQGCILPGRIHANLDKVYKNFLWGSTDEKKKLHGAAVCEQGSKWSIGNNNHLSFWEDKWLNLGTIRECIEGLLQKSEPKLRVCDIHISGMWELHKVSFILSLVLSQSIKATPIRTASANKDLLSLIASSRGDPKSAYLITCGDNASEGCFQGAWIWKLKTFPKIQMFLWKCYYNSIPVKVVLAQRGIQMPLCCDKCHDKPKTISHV